MAEERKTIHVVSNSHWDREWGYPFEETRLLLVKFMDELLHPFPLSLVRRRSG
jgi:alpha-mannosidase